MVRLTAIALALATTLAATPPAQHLQRHARPISNTTRPVHDHAHQHQHGGGHPHGGHPHSRGAWLFVLATLLALPMCMSTGAAARAICGPLRGTAAPSEADSAEMETLRSDEDSSAQRALQSCFPYLPDLIKYAPAAGVVVAFLVINSSLSLLNRWALGLHGLRFPLLLTASHMIFGSALLSPLMLLHDGYYARHREEVCGRGKALAAIGLMNAAQISLNNWSLVYIELAINQVVRSMGPVLVAIIGIGVEGKVPTRRELGCLAVLTIGVALTLQISWFLLSLTDPMGTPNPFVGSLLQSGGEMVDEREARRAAVDVEYAAMLRQAVESGEAPPPCATREIGDPLGGCRGADPEYARTRDLDADRAWINGPPARDP